MKKNIYKDNFENISQVIVTLFMFIILTYTLISPFSYAEVDSYILPLISLEYNHSIIISQDDINRAKEDLPDLYSGIDSFDDLRNSKLCMIDENHGMAWYFPVYALVCLPVKLILQVFGLNPIYTFQLTNAILFIIALWIIYHFYCKEKKSILAVVFLMFSPVWYYLDYIAAETFLCSLVAVSVCMWLKRKYKIAAFLISVGAMMNPGVMGFGIILFVDYFIYKWREEKFFFINKQKFIEMGKLCSCYIPSLIPFGVNYYYLGTFNPTAGTGNVESVWQRTMAYMFDLNFGIASISIIIVVLYILAIVILLKKKKIHEFLIAISVIFTIAVISFHTHINCGMTGTARYIYWIYPGVVFSILFLLEIVKIKAIKKFYAISMIAIASIGFTFFYNGGVAAYSYLDFNNISKFILDRYPQLYVSFCDSTFNSRANHIDGGYDTSGVSIYADSVTGEIRRIMYCNTEENKEMIENIVNSTGSVNINEKFKNYVDSKVYKINIGRYADEQYTLDEVYSTGLYNWVKNLNSNYDNDLEPEEILDEAHGILESDNRYMDEIYEMIDSEDMNTEQYISLLYNQILGRKESKDENVGWIERIESGTTRKDALYAFLTCDEFKDRYE